jgi:hypothetical protein
MQVQLEFNQVQPQTSRRNDIQLLTLLGSQATGLANAEYDLTVVSLASKDPRATSLPEQDNNPSRLVNKYLDSVADHKVRHRPTSKPVPPHCPLPVRHDERQHHQGLCPLETSNDTRDIQPDAQTVEPLPFAGEGPQL